LISTEVTEGPRLGEVEQTLHSVGKGRKEEKKYKSRRELKLPNNANYRYGYTNFPPRKTRTEKKDGAPVFSAGEH